MLKLFTRTAIIRIAGAATQLMFTIAVARVCGRTNAGVFFFGYSILFIVSTFCRCGTEISGLRSVAIALQSGNQSALWSAFSARVRLVTGVAGIVAGLMFIATPVIASGRASVAPGIDATLRLTALSIPALALLGLFSEMLKGAHRANLALTYQNIAIPLITMPTLLVLRLQGPIHPAQVSAILMAGSWIVALSAGLGCIRSFERYVPRVHGWMDSDRAALTDILRDAPNLLIVSTTPVVMQWIGSALLGYLAPPEAVAGYSVAIRISIAVSIVQSAVTSVLGPKISAAHAREDGPEMTRLSQETSIIITAASMPILLGMFVFAPACMSIFGGHFSEYASVLRLLIVGQLVAAIIGHCGNVLALCGEYRSARTTSILAVSSLALASLLFVPQGAAIGAAAAMSAGVIVGHVSGFLLVRQVLSMSPVPTSMRGIRSLVRGPS